MGWSIGSDGDRDIGYGVPAICDNPNCSEEIHRGLSYVCGSDPYGGEHGCGLFFCGKHLYFRRDEDEEARAIQVCDRCYEGEPPFDPKPDVAEWIKHKLTDESWQQWRDENAEEVEVMKKQINL